MRQEVNRYYSDHEDYLIGWWMCERRCLFDWSYKDGKSFQFEINVYVKEGKMSDNDFFKIEKRSQFVFEAVIYEEVEQKSIINS